MKNKLFALALGVLLLAGAGVSLNRNINNENKEVLAYDDLSIKNDGDAFILMDKQYGEKESFVYTGDLHFRSGQAGGLAFGSQENDHYFVINMDRYENHIKLLHFATNNSGGWIVDELRVCDFIGNDKMTDSERSMVAPQVRDIENVNLKVIVTIEEKENPEDIPHAYAEFYVEGIKRFGVDSVIDLNDLGKPYRYEGGYLGMNCFNSDVYLNKIEIGKSDYSYFSEPYRNQYHLQPFSKWTNDPNGLCYYNGWYHVFYQTHPFGLQWGTMYWGHARSRDLIHFEFLPICLFPDTRIDTLGPGETVENRGYMWSGCAITYTKGMSASIDALNWFPNGEGNGLFAIYTREGRFQDQQIITSDDEGLTWTKRDYFISHEIYYTVSEFERARIDWRDPKVVPLEKDSTGKVTRWVMTLSSMDKSLGWFLTSSNLLNWSYAGHFKFPRPECIGIGYLKDQNGVEHAYLTNKSRTYIFGNLSYDSVNNRVNFIDENGVNLYDYNTVEEIPLKPLDFGPDTYASQSFYINDPASEFNGKDIVINWFSGDLNASYCTGPGEYANLRGRWNGGFTTPVEYGVLDTDDGLVLTQKPITVGNVNLQKTNIKTINNQNIDTNSENPLNDVHTHVFELDASITVTNNSPITFKVDVGEDEYMQFGWNETDGYYVDRTYLDDKGINTNVDWHARYSSHIMGSSDTKTFYVLSDNGGLEVFCENYSIPFYFVTTASMYSNGASLKADSAIINHLELNEIKSAYRRNVSPDEGVLYVASNSVNLDTQLTTSKYITCWYSGVSDLVWEELENDGVVSYVASNQGINLTAINPGTASFKVSVDDKEEIINVVVSAGYFDSEFTFKKDNIVSGTWMMSGNTLVGEKASGNGFILAQETGDDFSYTGQFDIVEGVAASLVFRASSDLSSYIVANYDANEKVVKLWSTHGELTRSEHVEVPLTNIGLTVKAKGKNVVVSLNGNDVINYNLPDNEPLSGQFGLNVFSGKAVFKGLSLMKENYQYSEGELEVSLQIDQFVKDVYNITAGNTKLEPGYYYQSGKNLYIKESYLSLLENGKYQFKVVASSSTFYITVEVNATHKLVVEDMTVESGVNVNVYVGNTNIDSLIINGETIQQDKYSINNYVLTIDHSCFNIGDNEVKINNDVTFNVKIVDKQDNANNKNNKQNYTPFIIAGSVTGGAVVVGGGAALLIVLLKRKGKML